MPSFVKIKEHNIEKDPSADADVSSDESAYELLSSDDSDSSSDEDAQSLSPEEILLSSDKEKVSETAWQDKHNSDVSLASDVMEFLQETSSDESDVDVPLNYKERLKKYRSYRQYTQLKANILKNSLPRPVTSMKDTMSNEDILDAVAQYFYPPDGPQGYYPVYTYGDGNCLPRALSHLFYGTPENYDEVRCRIIEAGVKFEDELLSHDVLTRGVTNGSKNQPQMYATYSPRLLL